MREVEAEVDRYLTLLRNKIRERGFIQMEVQEALGWGRSYISQLLTKQKTLKVKQVLLILEVIGVDAADFFRELYSRPRPRPRVERRRSEAAPAARRELEELSGVLHRVIEVLLEKRIVTELEVQAAAEAADREATAETS